MVGKKEKERGGEDREGDMRTKRESDGREGGREEGGKEGKKKKMVEYLEKLANLLYLLNG